MTGWRVLDASGLTGRLGSGRGSVIVTPDDGSSPTTVAAVDIAVILIGPRVTVSSAALHRIHDAGGIAMFTDWRGVPEAGSFSWSTHSRVGRRQRAQVCMSVPRRKNAWARIVRAKIIGQAATLAFTANHTEAAAVRDLARRVRSGDPTNVESLAARRYWSGLALDEGFTRRPGDARAANTLLDYGYGVLRGYTIRAVCAAVLLPSFGLHHDNRSNAFNLADDLIEPFRPAVDAQAWEVMRTGATELQTDVRQALVEAAGQPFTADGATIPTCLNRLAQHVGQMAEGTLSRLDVPAWQGPAR